MKEIVVLISGNGSNLQAILDAIQQNQLSNCCISLVLSNRKNAYGLERAKKAGVKTSIFSLKSYKDVGKSRVEYDQDLAKRIVEENGGRRPALIVLAGFMHILSKEFLDYFQGLKIINLHPALPGKFDGYMRSSSGGGGP